MVVAGCLIVPTLLSPMPVRAAYYDNCALEGGFQKTYSIMDRPAYTDITGVLMDVDLRTLQPCFEATFTNPTFTISDQAFVIATLQGNNSGIQVGYAKCGKSGGCNGVPHDGKVHFISTRLDNEGTGQVYLADSWYRAPVVGNRYRLKVEATAHNGNAVWQYCIRNLTRSEGYACAFYARTWTNGDYAWRGTETGNTRSQNGNKFVDADLNLIGFYKRDGAWYQRQDSTNTCRRITLNSEPYPSWYGCAVLSDQTTLWSWTYDH